jgi:hypothetical protein
MCLLIYTKLAKREENQQTFDRTESQIPAKLTILDNSRDFKAENPFE